MDVMEKKQFIFGSLFLMANKLQVIGDQYLERDGMTTKQWFLTVMISQFRENSPTLSEVAELIGSSRQNVKQLALKLEEKDFMRIEKDNLDARALRLKLTDKSRTFWEERQNKDNQFLKDLFSDFGEEELDSLYNSFNKIFEKIKKTRESYMK